MSVANNSELQLERLRAETDKLSAEADHFRIDAGFIIGATIAIVIFAIYKAANKKPPRLTTRGFLFGGAKRDRTADLNTASVALSQLS